MLSPPAVAGRPLAGSSRGAGRLADDRACLSTRAPRRRLPVALISLTQKGTDPHPQSDLIVRARGQVRFALQHPASQLQCRPYISEIAVCQAQQVGAIIRAEVAGHPRLGVCKSIERRRPTSHRVKTRSAELFADFFKQTRSPETCFQCQALVVGGVLHVSAIREELGPQAVFKPVLALRAPPGGRLELGKAYTGGQQSHGLYQKMIVALGSGVQQRGMDPSGVFGDE